MSDQASEDNCSVRLIAPGDKKSKTTTVLVLYTKRRARDALALVNAAPSDVLVDVPYDRARSLADQLEYVGATVEITGEGANDPHAPRPWWKHPAAFDGLGRSGRLSLREVKYLGGWGQHPKTHGSTNTLAFSREGVSYAGLRTIFTIPWSEIAGIEIEGPEQASQRITVSRAITLGVFALAAKKQTKMAVICVLTHDEDEACFQTDKVTAPELRARLTPMLNKLHRASAATSKPEPWVASEPPRASPISVADELTKLAGLRDQGILTDAEFDAQKAKLLG